VPAALNLPGSRTDLVAVWRAGVAAVQGETLLRHGSRLESAEWRIDLPDGPLRVPLPDAARGARLRVIGAGKAAASLARGVEAVLGARIDDGLVVVKHGHAEDLRYCRQLEAGHPVPDAASARAAAAVLEFVGTPRDSDLYLVLLTGGASSLLASPAPGLTLDDKAAVTRLLVASGATIAEINVVRRHLSRLKGGQLARALAPAASVTLAISDVLGDEPAAIGSGPTVADPSTFGDALAVLRRFSLEARTPPAALRRLRSGAEGDVAETPKPADPAFANARFAILASLGHAVAAAGREARAAGYQVVPFGPWLQGDAHARAREFARRLRDLAAGRRAGAPPLMLVAGGETTLEVRGTGRGGRNQEFAVIVAQEIAGAPGLCALAAGTDGTDGPTDAAGGFADGGTVSRALAAGLDPVGILRENDSNRLLRASGDLFVSGPTGTNVTDLVLGVVETAGGSPAPHPVP
jgi:hydroxypyruvate reductase